jgi:hypothetical protein
MTEYSTCLGPEQPIEKCSRSVSRSRTADGANYTPTQDGPSDQNASRRIFDVFKFPFKRGREDDGAFAAAILIFTAKGARRVVLNLLFSRRVPVFFA